MKPLFCRNGYLDSSLFLVVYSTVLVYCYISDLTRKQNEVDAFQGYTLKIPALVCKTALQDYYKILITSASLQLVLLLPVKLRQLGLTKDP